MELFTDQLVPDMTYEQLSQVAASNTLFQPRIVGALQLTPDGLVILGERNIVLDAKNRRILINDGSDDRVLIGDDGT